MKAGGPIDPKFLDDLYARLPDFLLDEDTKFWGEFIELYANEERRHHADKTRRLWVGPGYAGEIYSHTSTSTLFIICFVAGGPKSDTREPGPSGTNSQVSSKS